MTTDYRPGVFPAALREFKPDVYANLSDVEVIVEYLKRDEYDFESFSVKDGVLIYHCRISLSTFINESVVSLIYEAVPELIDRLEKSHGYISGKPVPVPVPAPALSDHLIYGVSPLK